MAKEDNLSDKERIEVKKEIKKALADKLKEKTSAFHTKFKEQTATAIFTAFGLVVALAWKDVITEIISKLTPFQNLLLTAIVVTIFSIIGTYIVSKWSKLPDTQIKITS